MHSSLLVESALSGLLVVAQTLQVFVLAPTRDIVIPKSSALSPKTTRAVGHLPCEVNLKP